MAVVEHRVLTGSSVHELKGADTAAADTVPIADGAGATSFAKVDTAQIADDAITTVKILDGAVTEPKLADNAVSTRTIQDGAVTQAKLADSAFRRTINTQTGTTYTLVAADTIKYVRMDNAAANTLTVPLGIFEVGTQIDISQVGAGQTTIAGAVGVTINGISAGSTTINSQWGGCTIIQVATNTWDLVGDTAVVA